ncbi:MAG: DUF6153 family protein [Nocardioides sp.]
MTNGHRLQDRGALRRLLAVAALLGLITMHGLASPGSTHGGHLAGAPSAASPPGDRTVTHVSMAEPTVAAAAGRAISDDSDGELVGAAGMCLAVLLVGLGLALLRGRGFTVRRAADGAVLTARRPARARRHGRPPSLFALSVQRC